MKILLIHSHYRRRGGEDTVFEQETALLKEGHEVETLVFQNKNGCQGGVLFLLSIWNIFAAARVKTKIHQFQPDIVHIHNTHFASGPIIIRTIKKLGIPLVLTLHNYRLLCPSETLIHHGVFFGESLYADFPWEAVRNRVFRNSFTQTFWLAFTIWFHKKLGTWQMVDQFITLTKSSRKIFIKSALGIEAEKFIIKPNFVFQPEEPVIRKEQNHFLFVGRLSEEKGIHILLEAFKHTKYQLYIAGEGSLDHLVIKTAAESGNIHFLGSLDRSHVREAMLQCSAIIFPSVWYEPFGLVLIEALSVGTPVIASRIGSASEIIQDQFNGLHFEAGNAADLRAKLEEWSQFTACKRTAFSHNATESYAAFYTQMQNIDLIMSVYRETIHKTEPFEIESTAVA